MARLALPVERGIGALEYVEIDFAERSARFDDQLAQAAIALTTCVHLHRLEIGEKGVAFLDGRFLVAEKELRRAQPERVIAALEYVAQDDVHHLRDEERRRINRAAEEAHVAGFHGARIEQPVAEPEHHLVVMARIGVAERGKLSLRDAPTRLGHERR